MADSVANITYLHADRGETTSRYRFVDQLVRKYDAELRGYLLKILGNQEDASDVVQETYLKLYRLGKPEEVRYPKALLFRAASNLAMDRLKGNASRPQPTDDELVEVEDTSSNLEQRAASQEVFDYLLEIVNELPERRRQVLIMKKFSELTNQEISKSLGITRSMVEQHMTRALKHCRLRLRELGME